MDESKETELIKADRNNFEFDFNEYKFIFYSALFYSFGLFVGSYFYKLVQGDKINNLVQIKDGSFIFLLISNFCLYFSIFLITAFLGFCLIGKPIIYGIPVFIGICAGMRMGYYFLNFGTKGVGYSLIMIVPYVALFMSVIAYTIKVSTDISTRLIMLTKWEGENTFEISPYLKKYLIYSLIIIGVTLLDSGLTKLLFSVVTI